MRVGVRRIEEHGEKAAHIVDLRTRRGLILRYQDELDLVRIQDMEYDGQQMVDYLVKNTYIPMDVPDEEFDSLYGNCKPRKLLSKTLGDDFDTSKTPNLRDIIEESQVDYAQRVAKIIEQAQARYS